MANYDDVVEQNKKYLTQAQINALAAASKEYNVQNAGNRAGALASAREQLDVGYRGLQNMGLAGGLEAQATSGEVPRLQAQVQTNFDRYNQKLSDVEHQRLSALGANMAAQTQAARAAAAAAQRARMEAAGKLVANSLFDTAKKIGEGLVRANAGIGVKKDIKATPTEQYDEPVGPLTQKQYMEQQQRQQQFNTMLAAAQVLGVSVPNLPAQMKGEKSSDASKSAVVGAALESKKNPGKAWKTTPQDQKQARQNVNQSASVLATGTGYDTAADKQALTDAENRLSDLKQKRHYGGKVTDDELNSAQAAVNTARMKVEQPETYAALSVYNDPASKGTPAYKKAVGIIANEEAKALVKDVYGRDIDTKMTYDEFEAVGKDIKDLKKVIDRLDHAQKALEIAKENKLAPQSIAEDQKFIDDALADLKKLGYTEEEARDLVKNYANDRDARAEIEYYKNALYADMLNDGKRPTIGVNKNETDPTYRAVNHLPDIGDNNLVVVPGRLPIPSLQSTKTVLSSAEHMNESQRAAYNAIYEEEGIKAANEYATAIRPLTNIQQARDDESYAKELVNDNVAMAVLSNLASVPVRAAGSIPAVLEKYIVGGLNAVNDEITGGAGVPMYIDTNSNAHQMTNFASSIRSETSRRIIESNKDDPVLGEWANRAYQIGMSMGDSAFNMALGIAVAPWMTGLLAGSDAANEAYKDARARGGTQNQALAMATASGIAENLFEQVSLEYFTNQWIKEGAAWTRPFIVKWALGAGVEGSEEVATSIANLLSDVYIMHDKSEWEQLVQEKGTKQAILDELKSLGWEGLGGAISGGVFGLFGGAFNGALKYAGTTQLGKKAQSLGYTQKYQDMATVLGGKAEKTSAKLGTNPSAHQVGKLVNQVNNQLSSAFTGNEKIDIPMALMFSGKQLSFTEANDVYQALGSDTLKKMGYDAGSAREFMNSYNKRMVDSGIYSRVMQQQKERMENLGSAQAEEHLTSTEQLGGTEYGDKRNKWLQDAKKAAEEKVWKNPRMGLPVTTDAGEEVPVMPGNMTAVEFAEMQRKNFQARTTVTKGRATYELASMEARQGLTNEQAYNEMRGNLQDDMVSTADFYENLANNLGLDIVIHDVMPYTNGFLKDGKLHVVLGSRQNAVRIASHELTHYIKAFSPAKFNSLQTYLIADVGQEKFDKMVTEKAAQYGFDTSKKSGLENAREEVCAELCERMLSNEQMLQRFAQKDTSTAKTMKEHLSQTLDTIKRVLNDQGDDFGKKSGLVKSVRTMDSWIDSLTSAIAAAEEQKKTMAGQVAVTAGVTEADHQNLIKELSETETEEEFDEVFAEYSVDVIAYDMAGYMQDLADHGVMTQKEIDDLFDTMNEAITMVKANRAILDFGAELNSEEEILAAKRERAYLPYKQNADPHYKLALDFSTLCRKRVLLQSIQERLQAQMGRALTQEETVAIRLELQKLQREGYKVEVACALCYVEAARLKSPKVINTFLNNTGAEMRNYFAKKNPASKQIIEGLQQKWKVERGLAPDATKDDMKAAGVNVTDYNNYSREKREQFESDNAAEKVTIDRAVRLANNEKVMIGGIEFPGRETFLSASWLTKLKSVEPDIFNAFTDKVRSATRSKAQETDTFYSRGDIDMVTESILNYANAESGFRHQSWSDFVPTHLLDTMASVIEMSTRKAKMHAYTKVPSMVRLLGKTGMALNMSLIPAGDTGLVDGSLFFDSIEGMPWETMTKLRDMFPDTAGNIAIGINGEQIQKLLASNDIDYVIPYHASGMNKNMRGYLDIRAWSEYTSSQNEKTNHRGAKGAAPELAEWFDEKAAAKAKDGYAFMRAASEKYLQLCYERNLTPKFSQYLTNNGDGSYSLKEGYENYWKMLTDRKMVNQKTGKVIIQEAVKPIFDKDTVLGILEDRLADPAIQDAAEAAYIVTDKFSGWQADRNNASAEAIQESKNIRDRTAAITAQKTAEASGIRYSIDTDAIRDAFTAVYQAALDGNQEQLRNLPAFLDSVSNGNTELRKALGDIFSKLPETTTKPATRRTQSKPAQARQPGMKPQGKDTRVRDVQVPEYAKTGDRVSDWVRSFFESDKASDEIVAQLMDKVQNGEWGTYTQLTNEDAMNQAKAYIAKKQFTEAQADFHAMVASGRYNVHTRALGLQLLTEAANRGDAASVLDIATDLRTIATDAGQSLQILSVMKELGGVGAGWYMQKEIDRLNAQYADDISSGKMNEITVDPELMQQLIQASTQAEIEAAEDAIAEQVAAQLPLTFKSKIVNWRYLSMLGNPTTHFRNLAGNVFMSGLNAAKDVVATGIERVGVRDQSQRAHAVLDRNDRKMWKDIAARSFQEQEKNLRGSGKNGFGSFIQRHMRSFDNKTLNAIAQGSKNGKNVITKNGVMGMLEVEDVWFLRPAYQNAFMQYMKAQGFTVQDGVIGKVKNGQFTEISNVEMGKAIDWASQQAWKATFRDASTIASILNNASQKLGPVGHVLIEGVMPFKKTPVNIAKRGIEYSPVGVIMGGVQLMRDVKQGKMTAAQAIDNLASGVVGTSLMALGMAMAKAGLLRAGGEDKKKHETYLSDTGDQTYALKFGDVSLGVSALAPAAIPLLMGAALYDKITSDGEELDLSSVTETVAGTLDPFMEMSVVSSLNSALKNYNNNGIGGALGNTIMTAIQSYGSQFLPTVTGKVGQFIDPTVRTTKSSAASPLGANLDYYGRSLLKKVPGLEATLQPDVNVWGRETKKDGFTAWALDFANKFLLPFNVKISNRDVIDNELIRLVESTNDVNILPSDGSKYYTVKGKKYPMTAAQYTEFSKDRGNASYAAIKETMASAAYQNATTDEAKAYLLENALKAAQKQVDAVWKEKLGAIELDPDAKPAEGVKAIQGDYSDPALYKVAASYPNAYDKAAKAKSKGVSPDTFLDLYDKKETYIGDDRSDYMREQIMNSNLSTEQKELMDDLIVSDKGQNPDYSSNDWFEISMLGKTQYDEAKGGQKIGLNPNVYLAAYSKYKEANAKDKDGKYVHTKKEAKKILKEYLDKLPVSAPVYDYIWTVVFNYKKQ